mgnify:FL=1
MIKKISLAMTVLVALAFSGPLYAHCGSCGSGPDKNKSVHGSENLGPHHGKGYKGKHFKAMDTNSDGKISAQEWQTAFDSMDSNKDGLVTKDEMNAFHKTLD